MGEVSVVQTNGDVHYVKVPCDVEQIALPIMNRIFVAHEKMEVVNYEADERDD